MTPASTKVVPADSQSVGLAAQWMRQGFLASFPTETVYGLGGSTFDEQPLSRIYRLKGRPGDNPLIAHLRGLADLDLVADPTPAQRAMLERLAAIFWPGPLTIVVPKRPAVPLAASGGRDTIAVRVPAHPVALALLEAFGGPISAPSANRSGHVSPTSAAHVLSDFPEEPQLLVVDGGPSRVGVESTVLDLTSSPPRILRPGSVTESQIAALIGPVESSPIREQSASPGTAARHYSPRTPARMLPASRIPAAIREERPPCVVLAITPIDVPAPHARLAMPPDAESYASRLYSVLREVDDAGFGTIIVERPLAIDGLWAAILDRLERATTAS
ncbi:MAG: L-threonylcarbamoyladenylate synthase [Phycisphaerales bacterium]|jgi:L-threonylcarbamoyladenylate synthase